MAGVSHVQLKRPLKTSRESCACLTVWAVPYRDTAAQPSGTLSHRIYTKKNPNQLCILQVSNEIHRCSQDPTSPYFDFGSFYGLIELIEGRSADSSNSLLMNAHTWRYINDCVLHRTRWDLPTPIHILELKCMGRNWIFVGPSLKNCFELESKGV
jgi:hypothetical protein